MTIVVEPVWGEFIIGDEEDEPLVVRQVKVISLHDQTFLDPDQVKTLIEDLSAALQAIGE